MSEMKPAMNYREASAPGLTCVPYARSHSTIALRGDAYTWWDSAENIYQRGQTPRPGAILVLSRSSRLRAGHVAVVTQVLGARQIVVEHANWIRGRVITGMPVVDVSPNNDWTALRFWYQPARTYGDVYAASGFIYGNMTSPDPLPATDSVAPITLSRDRAGDTNDNGTVIVSGSGVSIQP
jgi:hypothetical protein